MPSQLGGLTSLEVLLFAGGWLNGVIQRQLSGSLPTQLGLLTKLKLLSLGTNRLSGTLITQLGLLTSLSSIHDGLGLGTNFISGTIATQLGSLAQLPVLTLETNALSGTIPTWLGAMTKLRSLNIQQNLISGSLPTSLGMLVDLGTLEAYSNRLTGAIPSQLGNIYQLGTCYLTVEQCLDLSQARHKGQCEASDLKVRNATNAFECPLPPELSGLQTEGCARSFPCAPPPAPPLVPPRAPPPPPPRAPPLSPKPTSLPAGVVAAIAVSAAAAMGLLLLLLLLLRRAAQGQRRDAARLIELQDLQEKPMTMLVDGEALTLLPALERLYETQKATRPNASHSEAPNRFLGALSDLILGEPREAALGVGPLLGLSGDALGRALTRGAAAIVDEIEASGTEEDRECLDYCLRREAGSSPLLFSNSPFPRDCDANGVLHDRRNELTGEGLRLADFLNHPHARTAQLTQAHVLALRLYTTATFKSINGPLRAHDRVGPHPLAVTVHHLNEAVKQLRTVSADRPDAHEEFDLWRGVHNVRVTDEFAATGGSERAPMSCSPDAAVAVGYASGASSLLLKIVTSSFIDRGADLSFVSAFPTEREYLYPPLSYLQPTGRCEELALASGAIYTVVECRPRFAS